MTQKNKGNGVTGGVGARCYSGGSGGSVWLWYGCGGDVWCSSGGGRMKTNVVG